MTTLFRPFVTVLSLFLILAISSSLPVAGRQRFNSRLENLANQVVRQARNAADRFERDYQSGFTHSRRDIQRLYQARMFVAGAELLAQMTRDGRPETELNDAIDFLRSQATFETGWSGARSALDDFSRELRFSSGNAGRNPSDDRNNGRWNDGRVTGRMRWLGRVDDEIYVYVRDSETRTELVSGQPTLNERFTFTSPLPRRPVTVSVNRLRGRGRVEVFQQPSANNDFTAVIRIVDRAGGATDMEFELVW
ncbi:MAG: hypothetical protein CFK52_08900 [Chloracidobacterium sp. CP2_5A]|nr:MAG: hypothetical protein CFK52_08900 [Chloracidobacterium sp. CP2_5A]